MESLLKAVCYHPSNLRGGCVCVCVCQGYFVWLEVVAHWWFGSYTSHVLTSKLCYVTALKGLLGSLSVSVLNVYCSEAEQLKPRLLWGSWLEANCPHRVWPHCTLSCSLALGVRHGREPRISRALALCSYFILGRKHTVILWGTFQHQSLALS